MWNGLLRNYVRDNALCRSATDFDARFCKIRRVALPEANDDAANKLYVEQSINKLRKTQEEFEKNIARLHTVVHALQENLQKVLQSMHE